MQTVEYLDRGAWRASLNACSTLLRRPGLSLAATARMSASRRLQRVRGTGKQDCASSPGWGIFKV